MAETVSNLCIQKLQKIGVQKNCRKSRGYIEDLFETTVDVQMTTIRQHCLLKMEAMRKHIASVENP